MTTTVTAGARRPTAPRQRGGAGRWIREHLVTMFGILALIYLFVPIFVVVMFSFNDPTGRFNYTWVRFSFSAWADPCGISGMCDALLVSLKIGVLATIVATILGTLAAFAMARHRFRGRAVANLLVFLPMATPEVVAGSSLLTLFINLGMPLGQTTIFIAHVMFCVSFVIVTGSNRPPWTSTRTGSRPSPKSPGRWCCRASCRVRCCRSR